MVAAMLVAGCGALPTAGPTASQVISQQTGDKEARFTVVDIDDGVIDRVLAAPKPSLRAHFPAQGLPPEPRIGAGDSLVVTIWEAAGGGLFASTSIPDQIAPGSRSIVLPEQIVARDGAISVPYAGRIVVAGRLPVEVQHAIEQRLSGKAIEPQVIVSVAKSVNNTVTVTGEAIGGARVPLSLKGDRLLDLIAAAGGSHAPVYETFIRLSRGGVTVTIPMERLVDDPRENIYAEPGDVLTVVKAPRSFTVFGATGQNNEINFPAATLSLAEALAKAGGLQDARSDPAGVFLFRYEPVAVLEGLDRPPAAVTPDGRAPVVYRLNWRDAKAYFAAARFPVEDKDVLYVANADLDELQKFFGLIGTLTAPAITGVVVRNATQ
ncbi:MAG TPA: polysaccharide biosynthesis/export family protein [Stellaceae bacterium]|nr:polysaccharide biosynthesis/export family protein [Stellaceae bacterium]